MRILPDLTQDRNKPQFSGRRRVIVRQASGFDGVTVSQTSLRDTQPQPDLRKNWERVFDAFDKPRRNRPERRHRRPRGATYVPRDGITAGELFGFYDRRTGQRIALCRGTIVHVMKEAERFAHSHGATVADLYVRVEDET